MKLEEKLLLFSEIPSTSTRKNRTLRNKNNYLYSVPKYDITASSQAMIKEHSQKEKYFKKVLRFIKIISKQLILKNRVKSFVSALNRYVQ